MPLRKRHEHTIDISRKPDGGWFFFLDGEDIADEVKHFKIYLGEDKISVRAEITTYVKVEKFSSEGVEVEIGSDLEIEMGDKG